MSNPRTLITPIPAGWDLPVDLATAVTARDEALERYADARDDQARARANVRDAARKDAAALRTLAREGGKDPGPDRHTVTADRALTLAQEKVRLTRQELIKANRTVNDLLVEHWSILAPQVAAIARAGVETYLSETARLKTEFATAVDQWQQTLEGFTTLQEAARAAGGLHYQDPPTAQPHTPMDTPPVARINWFADQFEQRARS